MKGCVFGTNFLYPGISMPPLILCPNAAPCSATCVFSSLATVWTRGEESSERSEVTAAMYAFGIAWGDRWPKSERTDEALDMLLSGVLRYMNVSACRAKGGVKTGAFIVLCPCYLRGTCE